MGTLFRRSWLLLVYVTCFYVESGNAVKCYQCSSDQDKEGEDSCGAYKSFDTLRNQPIECMGEEANIPGVFCYKSLQQSPRGFIWDGRWRTVTRRCAALSPTSVDSGCDWGYHENGVYWEQCYCTLDSCNGAESRTIPLGIVLTVLCASVLAALFSV